MHQINLEHSGKADSGSIPAKLHGGVCNRRRGAVLRSALMQDLAVLDCRNCKE